MNRPGRRCKELLEITLNTLSGGVVALILLAIQKDNLELNISQAVKSQVPIYSGTRMRGAYAHCRAQSAFEQGDGSTERIIKICMQAFPSIWVSCITVF
jgi:hypothetical protein